MLVFISITTAIIMKPIKILVIKIAIKKDNNINHEIDIELKAKIK